MTSKIFIPCSKNIKITDRYSLIYEIKKVLHSNDEKFNTNIKLKHAIEEIVGDHQNIQDTHALEIIKLTKILIQEKELNGEINDKIRFIKENTAKTINDFEVDPKDFLIIKKLEQTSRNLTYSICKKVTCNENNNLKKFKQYILKNTGRFEAYKEIYISRLIEILSKDDHYNVYKIKNSDQCIIELINSEQYNSCIDLKNNRKSIVRTALIAYILGIGDRKNSNLLPYIKNCEIHYANIDFSELLDGYHKFQIQFFAKKIVDTDLTSSELYKEILQNLNIKNIDFSEIDTSNEELINALNELIDAEKLLKVKNVSENYKHNYVKIYGIEQFDQSYNIFNGLSLIHESLKSLNKEKNFFYEQFENINTTNKAQKMF